jgi:hypothetical protein
MNELEAIELVDKLMMSYRNGIRPSDKDIARAVELGIAINKLKEYAEATREEGGDEIEEYIWN